jgi:environmental stress-induced protein Ves
MSSHGSERAVLHLEPADARIVPWKNGRGTTSELAIWPEDAAFERGDFEWRVACAGVAEAGAFSAFAGFERLLVVTRGDGLVLTHGDDAPRARLRPLEPYRFSGDWPTSAELVRGAIEDLNVLWRADRWHAEVEVTRLGRRRWRGTIGPGHAFAHALAGTAVARVTGEEEPFELDPGESLWAQSLTREEDLDLTGTADDALVVLVRIEMADEASR